MASRFLYDAIVVGGGIAGTSLAYALSKRKIKTLLLERHEDVASEGSGNPAGLIYPFFTPERSIESDFSFAAFDFSRKIIESVLPENTISPFPQSPGAFLVPDSEEEKRNLLQLIQEYSLTDEDVVLSQDDNVQKEGFLFKKALTVAPRKLTKHLLECCKPYLEVETYANYLGHFITETFQVRTDAAVYSSKFLFLCHSNGFIESQETNWIPLKRVRGQISLLPALDFLKQIPYSYIFGSYLTKDLGSGSVLGASSDESQMDESIRVEETIGFLERAALALPNLRDHFQKLKTQASDIHARVSFRLQARDNRPIFGKLPNFQEYKKSVSSSKEIPYFESLYLLGALGSKGLTHAMLASEVIVRDALGEENILSPDLCREFKPDRFLQSAFSD